MENLPSVLPSPKTLLLGHPLRLTDHDFVLKSRETVVSILQGKDPRTLLIVGPCSLHDPVATYEYALKLKSLAEEVKDTFFIVMRAYFEKPRTSIGWKGFMHDPHLDGSHDIQKGITETRILLKNLIEHRIPLAAEFLDPATPLYFGDLITWGCIGARTTQSQVHRQIASHLPLPIAFKNTTDGNIDTALYAIDVAKHPHTFIGMNNEGSLSLIHSTGNPYGHLVLRGSEQEPNCDALSINKVLGKAPHLLVDCSHDNSRKQPREQVNVFNDVVQQIVLGNKKIRGLMLESFLFEGNQPIGPNLKYGISITDGCLDFETTQHLIRENAALLQPCALL